jgi:hypothetical protein
MRRATSWILAVTVTLMAGLSAFAFQTTDQPIVLTDRRTAPGTAVDQRDATGAPIEASFLRDRASVSVKPHYDGLAQDLRAGIGLPY